MREFAIDSFESSKNELWELVDALEIAGVVPNTPIVDLSADNRGKPLRPDWRSMPFRRSLAVYFQGRPKPTLYLQVWGVVLMARGSKIRTPEAHLQLCANLPILVGSTGEAYDEWMERATRYQAVSLGDMHAGGGPYVVFKGEGHKRLVSRRWLDWGPWRVLRGPNDTTLVQFHDIGVDHETAREQAEPGHRLLSGFGGYIGQKRHFDFRHNVDALYRPEQRLLTVVVTGRKVPRREMLEMRARQLFGTLGPKQPIEHIAYVFLRESEAREHLHDLWLHDIECRAVVDGREVRLDEGYNPTPPERPEWVRRLEAEG